MLNVLSEQSYESYARVIYGPGIRVIAEVDQGLSEYYRSLIPKYLNVKPQKYKAHITIVRTGIETPLNMEYWGKREGERIRFTYEPVVQHDERYFWLNAQSDDIGKIRQELGLPVYRNNRNEYHITIANVK